ncbi:MAG: DUF4296 domain-containing protein [Bacteroidales bacterium]|nr:DUF4296 domain-containing protein [Bacteroidales bacterium]
MKKSKNINCRTRMVLLVMFITITALATGCSPADEKKSVRVPDHIISPDSMVSLITDLQITEATLREYKRLGQEDDTRSKAFMAEVFAKHQVTPQHYDSSTAWYEQHLELYQQIYTDVVTRISQMQAAETGKTP